MNHEIFNLIELILNEFLINCDCRAETFEYFVFMNESLTMIRERKLAEYFVLSKPLVIWDKKSPKQMVNLPIFCMTD